MNGRPKPASKTPSQSRIQSFFRKPNGSSAIKKKPEPLSLNLNGPKPSLPPPTRPNSQAKPKSSVEWWKTPPKGSAGIPGAKKRSTFAAEMPDFPLSQGEQTTSQSSTQTQQDGYPPAKRHNSSLALSAKPIARPTGMASSKVSMQSTITSSTFTDEQRQVLQLILDDKRSVFFTGAAGTGKSYLLKEVVRRLSRGRPSSAQLAITATTGLAAFTIGGQTIHKWSGMSPNIKTPEALTKKANRQASVSSNWKMCETLIIDEVSMMSADMLDLLEATARMIRRNNRPFGGIQVILTGDFFQLPPVSRTEQSKLCFEARCWPILFENNIVLSKVFRQEDDRLINMLNSMRKGHITDEINTMFQSLSRKVTYDDGLEATELYPLRGQVDSANAARMIKLPGNTYRFAANDNVDNPYQKTLLNGLLTPEFLELKIGAQVLLTKNIDDELVNGRRGEVITFMSTTNWAMVHEFIVENRAALNLYNSIINQPDHVGGFRPPNLNEMLDTLVYPHGKTRLAFEMLCTGDPHEKFPVVDFKNGQVSLLERESFIVSGGDSSGAVERKQVPLTLSWALSIHKSQGQTLDRVVVDLSKVFEAGQAYVAVSRATSYDRLQVLGYDRKKIKIHPKVASFYDKIEGKSV